MQDILKTKAYILLDRYYPYVLIGVLTVVVALGLYSIILPQYYGVQNTSAATYQQSAAMLTEREHYLNDLQVMEANYTKLDKRMLSYMYKILPKLPPEMLFAEIEGILRKSKFTVQSINISPGAAGVADSAVAPTTTKDLYSVTQVSVNVIGKGTSYADFKELLQQFENSAHLIELGSLTYNSSVDSYTLVLKIYSL